MRKNSLALLAIVLAAGCATNERVASIDSRLAQIEASIQFQSRLVKLETEAKLDSAVVVRWHDQVNDARVSAMERREETLRLAVADLERKLGRLDKNSKRDFTPPAPPATAANEPAPTEADAWYGQWGWSFNWNKWNRELGHQLFKLYSEGDKSAKFLQKTDDSSRPYMPRDPGKTGLGAEDSLELVGRELPHTEFKRANGNTLDVKQFRGKKNVVIVILRGFDPKQGVCIACTGQTLALAQNLDRFEEKDAVVFLVYPGKADTIPKFTDAVQNLSESDAQLPLEILLDVDLAVVHEFRIKGQLAKPTTLVVDKKGIVRFAHVGQNKTDRPTVPVLLDVLSGLEK